jgi:hypothetical protein
VRLLPYFSAYRRNYIDGLVRRAGAEFDWDVITELEFGTQEDYDAWLAALATPEILCQIHADETNFIDSTQARMWAVTRCATGGLVAGGDTRVRAGAPCLASRPIPTS